MKSERSSQPGSGSESNAQSSLVRNCFENAAGIRMFGWRPPPPASSSSTRVAGSSERRLASAQPADPAPTIT